MSELLEYWGLDWLGMGLSLLASYLLGNQRRIGFLVFIVANVIWVFLGFAWFDSIGTAVGNLVFLLINLRGYLRWTRKGAPEAG
ncbi:MAG: hypothetical protein WBA12_00200 [Catalinimonas sp.]